MKNEVRVRMAPSPTGFFHVGSAHTALYNWLFAQHHRGKFILRVEDTDVTRSSEEMIKVILDGLKWLGLNWDEGPYFQSQRLNIYQNYVQKLLENGKAYYCYCKSEELEAEKKSAYRRKEDWRYDRRCLNLTPAERAEKDRLKIPKAVRFLVPDKAVVFNDIIHQQIKREPENIEDFIIMRDNGMPTYNLACVVDDYEMAISHVIRAVEHITNTPKQILLFEALGLPKPEFAHLPLILGADKKKLSKRHGAASLMSYKDQGYLPEAVVNFLAILGWSPGDDKEIMDIDEVIGQFSLERINPANAVFDEKKLEWMNGQYIYKLSNEELLEYLKPFLLNFGLLSPEEIKNNIDKLIKICQLVKLRLKTLADINKVGRFFFVEDFDYEPEGHKKYFNKKTFDFMHRFLVIMENIKDFNAQSIEQSLRDFAQKNGLKAKEVIHPLRFFISGKEGGPGLFETLEIIGQRRCLQRIKRVLKKTETHDG